MDLKEMQAETILGPINEILESGKFENPEQETGEGDTVIGEMTDYEKAIWTVLSRTVGSFRKMVENLPDNPEEANDEDVEKTRRLKEKIEALKDFFWASLRHRLGEVSYQGAGIGVRSDFQIVTMAETEEENPLADILRHIIVGVG